MTLFFKNFYAFVQIGIHLQFAEFLTVSLLCSLVLDVTGYFVVFTVLTTLEVRPLTRSDTNTVEPGVSKNFGKRKKVYYCQEFTIEKVIYVIN